MNALAWILATSTAAAGVDYGWQPSPAGDLEYVIQIEPEVLAAMRAGEEITSEIPPELAGVRKFRIRVGSGPVPRILPSHALRAGAGLHPNQPVEGGADVRSGHAATHSANPLEGLPPPPNMRSAQPGAVAAIAADAAAPRPSHLKTTPNPFGRTSDPGQSSDPRVAAAPQPADTWADARRWDPRAPLDTLGNEVPTAGTPAHSVLTNQAPSLNGGSSGQVPAGTQDRTGRFQMADSSRFYDRQGNPTEPLRGGAQTGIADPRYTYGGEQGLPARPPTGGASASIRAEPPPPAPTTTDRYTTANDRLFNPPSPTSSGGSLRTSPGAGLGGYASPQNTPSAAIARDSRQVDAAGLAAPRPIKEVGFDQPTGGTVRTEAFQMDKPTLPEELAAQPYKPWGWFIAVLFGLLISASANFYLGWLAWDLHRRYRSAVLQMTDAAALGV